MWSYKGRISKAVLCIPSLPFPLTAAKSDLTLAQGRTWVFSLLWALAVLIVHSVGCVLLTALQKIAACGAT